jgi:hypothetical protein
MTKAQYILAELRAGIVRDIPAPPPSSRNFVQVASPVSRRSAKTNGTRTRVLKVRNWGIVRGGMGDERVG